MTTRRTVMWTLAFLLLVPAAMAAADTAQRASDGDLLFNMAHLRPGDVYVYDVTLHSYLHRIDATVHDVLTVEVGAPAVRTATDGTTREMLPITVTRKTVPWDMHGLPERPDGGVPVKIEGMSTTEYRVDMETGAAIDRVSHRDVRTWYNVPGKAETVVEHDESTSERFGLYTNIIDHLVRPGARFSNGPLPVQLGLYVAGIQADPVDAVGTIDGRRVYDVATNYNKDEDFGTVSIFDCRGTMGGQYSDIRSVRAYQGKTFASTHDTETWVQPELSFPVLTRCMSEYRLGAVDGPLVERLDVMYRMSRHAPGGAEVPLAFPTDLDVAPLGRVTPRPVIVPGLPSDGDDTPLRLPAADAVDLLRATEDERLRTFFDDGEVPFFVISASYAPGVIQAADPTEGLPVQVPALPPLPEPLAPVISNDPERAPTWALTLQNARGQEWAVNVTRFIASDGATTAEEVTPADGGPKAAERRADPDIMPAEMAPIADVIRKWAADEGRDVDEWLDGTYRGFEVGFGGWYYVNDVLVKMKGQFTLQAEARPVDDPDSDPNWTTSHTYTLEDAGRTARNEQRSAEAEAERPQLETLAAAVPVEIKAGFTPTAAAAGGVAMAVGLAVMVFWDTLRGVLMKFLVMPLYAKIAKDSLLDHGTREEIVNYVETNPGANMGEVRHALGLGYGTAFHHLATLERNQLLHSAKVGRQRCFFTPGQLNITERRATGVLKSPAARRLVALVTDRPGITQSEAADLLGVTPKAVRAQAARLEEVGALVAQREGRTVRYRVGDLPAAAA